MKSGRQTTLRSDVTVSGIGVHSGVPATLTLHPAGPGTGIRFVRPGTDGKPDRQVKADVRSVVATDFATVIGDATGPLCSTAEHVLATLAGLGVDNAVIEIDGPEMPIMDGSAEDFVTAIDRVGLETTAAPRRYIKVLKPVRVADGRSYGELRPYDRGMRFEVEIAFEHPLIGRQALAFDLDPIHFRREIARARTFGFMSDVAKLWSAGYALGASFENTLVVAENRILNPDGLRWADEFVRHKALDAIGDLALAGAPLLGMYRSVRGGHKLNHAVISALMADPTAWTMVDATALARTTVRGRAELTTGIAAPAYSADVS
ncbi:UDP-3-O-[3-hydroxymyristoyl] N-acetylglucosamine deacetylase [Rhodoplanes elegans]|uniref:UDP-3-O-acyl-N-acetylglucosamine deacetylase n=1 Tax=Rhodoplanes elegans TaxID=29408 RepID=A0A327JZV9_9BRAD|nr:UDP-3-O-acyl-N-acetylglucosamine deacetylase [Rhodoplanes elegans]MBK5961371.1 UDP-3-O-[3-hydroxymyristoyl] N-acetylglucosamine deacetylase [Rhodoplanes elegans]RAI31136.1 UDP-3-O-[3-hydroxymyristoyl] N-acetylglucosamine deacetylase [Rhodoplanes elegans]